MQLMDEIKYNRLYSSNKKIYAPINPSERKKGAAIMLLTRTPVDSTTLMNLSYIYNPMLFQGLYIDRNVSAIIDSGVIVDDTENETVSEAMVHNVSNDKIKVKVICQTASTNDVKLVKDVYKEKNFNYWYSFFKANMNHVPKEVHVYVYSSVKEMAKAANKEALSNGEVVVNSYSNANAIYVVANSGFESIKKAEGGNYQNYLTNELITYVCMNTSKRCSRYMACQLATALSGQLNDKMMDKIENDWADIKDDSLAASYIMKKMYDADGPRELVKMCKTGDYTPLLKYGSRKFVKKISGLYEATLTAEQRKNISDKDYGLPKDKKYPMPDESHVRSAIRFFNHVDPSDEAELARNIKKKIKQYNMSVKVGEDNRFSKYYNESAIFKEEIKKIENVIEQCKVKSNNKQSSNTNESALLEATDLRIITELANIPDNKIVIGTDYHFIGYNDDKSKIIVKPKSYTDKIIKKQNDLVENDGVFIYLGDLFFRSFRTEFEIPGEMKKEGIELAKRLKGKYKILIRGNHDNLPDEFYIEKCGFTHVCSSVIYNNILFSHQPEIVNPPMINVHGHIHGTNVYYEKEPRGHMDVWTTNSCHTDTLTNILNNQEEYDKNSKQVSDLDKGDPHQYIPGKRLYLDEIIDESTLLEVKFENDKGEKVPKTCPKCGSKIGVFFRGEPVFLCSNKDCAKYFGTVPFKEAAILNESYYISIPKNDKEDIKDIIDTFTDSEKEDIGGYFFDKYNTVYYDIEYDGSNPIGFIAVVSRIKGPHGFVMLGVKKEYRGKGIAKKMANKMLNEFKHSKKCDTLTWNISFGNEASEKVAKSVGFKFYKKYNTYNEYYYDLRKSMTESAVEYIPLPTRLLTESFNEDGYVMTEDYIMTDNFITFFNGMDEQVISEAEKKYDSRLKRYLFKERLKNNKSVTLRYQEMKAMSPWIKKTYLKLPMYQRKNIFIDLSYYHGLFLEHLQYKKDIAIKMYWDFVNRLINDSEYKEYYNKITIYIPVYPDAWDTNDAEELMDYKKSINPISMIIRMLRKNPNELKKWGDRDIIFLSPKGYFKINFNNFQVKDLAKFKRFITKLVNNEDIEDNDEEDGYGQNQKEIDSPAVITANIADKIEKNMGVKIDDITGGEDVAFKPKEVEEALPSTLQFDHLRIRTNKINLPTNSLLYSGKSDKNSAAILVMAPSNKDTAEVITKSAINNKFLYNSKGFYKP